MGLQAQPSKRECEKDGDRTKGERERYCQPAVHGDCDLLECRVLKLPALLRKYLRCLENELQFGLR